MTGATILSRFRGLHPLTKFAVIFHLTAATVVAPVRNIAVADAILLLLAVLLSIKVGSLVNPIGSLVFCSLSVLIAIPGGTGAEIWQATVIGLRILFIMLLYGTAGVLFREVDFEVLGRLAHLPRKTRLLLSSTLSFIPIALRKMNDIVLAQRSRGLEMNLVSFLQRSTYRALVIPFILGVLRSALDLWIITNLQPEDGRGVVRKVGSLDILGFLLTLFIWLK